MRKGKLTPETIIPMSLPESPHIIQPHEKSKTNYLNTFSTHLIINLPKMNSIYLF